MAPKSNEPAPRKPDVCRGKPKYSYPHHGWFCICSGPRHTPRLAPLRAIPLPLEAMHWAVPGFGPNVPLHPTLASYPRGVYGTIANHGGTPTLSRGSFRKTLEGCV